MQHYELDVSDSSALSSYHQKTDDNLLYHLRKDTRTACVGMLGIGTEVDP